MGAVDEVVALQRLSGERVAAPEGAAAATMAVPVLKTAAAAATAAEAEAAAAAVEAVAAAAVAAAAAAAATVPAKEAAAAAAVQAATAMPTAAAAAARGEAGGEFGRYRAPHAHAHLFLRQRWTLWRLGMLPRPRHRNARESCVIYIVVIMF